MLIVDILSGGREDLCTCISLPSLGVKVVFEFAMVVVFHVGARVTLVFDLLAHPPFSNRLKRCFLGWIAPHEPSIFGRQGARKT
jgi:hypothetical protein